jgi:hypothetical protein
MTLPATGTITLNAVNTELTQSATAYVTLNDTNIRSLFGVPTGTIYMSNGYGKSFSTSAFGMFYLGGMNSVSNLVSNTIGGLLYSNESNVAVSATLPAITYYNSGFYSSTAGYSAGGSVGGVISGAVRKLIFSSKTLSTITATIVTRYGSGSGQSTAKGYVFGGANTAWLTEIDGILFSNDTYINPAAAINYNGIVGFSPAFTGPTSIYYMSQHTNGFLISTEAIRACAYSIRYMGNGAGAPMSSTTKGYAFCGTFSSMACTTSQTTNGTSYTSYYGTDAWSFSTETSASLAAAMPHTDAGWTGSESSSKGYSVWGAGGYSLNFSTETYGIIAGTLTNVSYLGAASSYK